MMTLATDLMGRTILRATIIRMSRSAMTLKADDIKNEYFRCLRMVSAAENSLFKSTCACPEMVFSSLGVPVRPESPSRPIQGHRRGHP